MLVGMWNVAAVMEKFDNTSQKLDEELLHDPSIPVLDIYSKELKTESQTDMHHCS